MACATKTLRFAGSVWSDGTTTAIFIGLLRVQVAQWKKMRVGFVLEGSSGLLTVSTAAIYANKESEVIGATVVDVPSGTPLTATADGPNYGTFVDIDTSKQILEIGFKAKNTSGSKLEKGLVTLTVDLSE